jgi:hypothetical protein
MSDLPVEIVKIPPSSAVSQEGNCPRRDQISDCFKCSSVEVDELAQSPEE